MNKPTAILGLSLLPCLLWAAGAQDYKDGGMALFRAGQYAKALVYFNNAVQADPNDAEAYEDLGNTYVKMGDSQNAREAYNKTLQIDPNNSTVREALNNLPSPNGSTAPSTTLPDHSSAAPASSTQKFEEQDSVTPKTEPWHKEPGAVNDYNTGKGGINRIDRAKLWLKFDGGYTYSVQTDLINSADAQNKYITASGSTGSALMDHNGANFGGEIGFLINPNNGLAIGLRGLRANDYLNNQNLQNGPATVLGTVYDSDFENETISAFVYPLTLDYYLFLPDAGGRFFISGGLGFYYGLVHVEDDYSYIISNNNPNVSDTFSGDLTSGGVGFQASLGRDFAVGNNFAISLFARGRYARLTNFRGSVYNPNTGGTATDGLAVFPDGTVHSTDVSNIGNNGTSYATIDFTGFDVGLAFTFFAY